jgi:hypothetical protein
MTTVGTINKAYKIATLIENEIKQLGIIVTAHVDDWSDYGSFRMFITFIQATRSGDYFGLNLGNVTLRKIGSLIRKEINGNQGVILEQLIMPEKLYFQVNYRKYYKGYNDRSISVDFRIID